MKNKKSLGQNFLINNNVLYKIKDIVYDIKNVNSSNILEIGPGNGALTNILNTIECKNLFLLEKDKRLIPMLVNKYPKAKTICSDAMNFNYNELFNGIDNIVVGNLPYYVSSKILKKLIDEYPMFSDMVLMFQKELANRIVANVNTSDYSRISLMVKEFYEAKIMFNIDKESFRPVPKVESSVVLFKKRSAPLVNPKNRKLYQELIDKAFMHRRKKIGFLFKNYDSISQSYLDKRAGELSIFDFEYLSNVISMK